MPACSCILIYVFIIFYAFRYKIKAIKDEEKNLSYCVVSLVIVYLLILVNAGQIVSCLMIIGLEIIERNNLEASLYKNCMVYGLGPLNVITGTFGGYLPIL